MHPQRLLQQLQAAAGDSPMQQALLMHLLQESLSLSQQSQAAQRAVGIPTPSSIICNSLYRILLKVTNLSTHREKRLNK